MAGRYRVVGLLGRGGMGEVYRADDLTLRQPVALKFLPRDVAIDETRLERLLGEVRIARRVSHSNVCRVFDVGECNGDHFITMEYVDGEDLASLVRRIGRVSGDKGVQIARQLCAGLAAAHDRDVTHRDLKPHNVMIDGQGQVRITDFGLAGLVDDHAPSGGTPAYMAPEQLQGQPATIKSDLYSLGLVLYEMFTGQPAFRAESRAELLRTRAESTVLSASSVVSELDPAISTAIEHCLQQDPSDRPESALAVAALLPGGDPLAAALAAGQTPSPELVAAAGERESMGTGRVLLCALCIAVGIVGVVTITSRDSLASYVPLERSPIALADRARELLRSIGYTHAAADTAMGFSPDGGYLEWLQQHHSESDDWGVLARPQPAAMYFWYRQSPQRFRIFSPWHARGIVTPSNPPWHVSGEAYVSLNLAGQLRRFYVVPTPHVSAPSSTPVEDQVWNALLNAAGMDITQCTPAEPQYGSSFRVDQRRAWSASYPQAPDIPIRIEAGSADGLPVYFRFVNPWERPDVQERADATPESLAQRIANSIERWDDIVSLVIVMSMMFGAGFVTFSPHYAGRGDRSGAMKIAGVGYFGMLFGSLLNSDSILPTGADDILRAMAAATFLAMGVWICYLGLEPFVRRRWPSMLIAWTRLLAGKLLDPLVGRSILYGVLAGLVFTLTRLAAQVPASSSPNGGMPIWNNFSVGLAPHLSLAVLCISTVVPLMFGFVYVLVLVFIRSVVGNRVATSIVFVLVSMLVLRGDIALLPWGPLVSAVSSVMLLVLLLRFGVLAAVVGLCCDMLLSESPLLSNLSAWYAHATMIPIAFLALLTLWGCLAATAGRPFRFSPAISP